MRFQVLLKTFQPALVSSCCFFSFLSLVCLWYFTLNVPQSKGSYETRQKQKPLSITQQTGNCGKALERGCLSLLNSSFGCPPPCGVPPELHFIWRFLSCLAHCDNSTTYPSQLAGVSGKGALQTLLGKWTGGLEKQLDSQLAHGAHSRKSSLHAACCGASQRGGARLPSWQGKREAWRSGLLSVWLRRLCKRPRNEVQFPLACLVLDLLPQLRGREY